MKIKKKFDGQGKLKWAKGNPQEICEDEDVSNSHNISFRIWGENGRWYFRLLPKPLASFYISGKEIPENEMEGFDLFVLIDSVEPNGMIAREIPSNTLIEAAVLTKDQP